MSCKESQLGTVTELTATWLNNLSFHIHQHQTQTFHILPLERSVSARNQFHIESVKEVQMNWRRSFRSSFFITLLLYLFFVALRVSEVGNTCLVSKSRVTKHQLWHRKHYEYNFYTRANTKEKRNQLKVRKLLEIEEHNILGGNYI